MKKIIVAIDGYSSCGKSTMAKTLARKIGYTYIDSGAMYRAVTLFALENGIITGSDVDAPGLEKRLNEIKITFSTDKETGSNITELNGKDVERRIRTLEVSSHVSAIAALPFIRTFLTAQQRSLGEKKGIVMDGRDIGTTVFPDAELKIFVTASAEVRARRRYDELQAKGERTSYEEIIENVKQRDYIDTHREVSPLTQAPDAVVLDNSFMTLKQQDEWLMEQYRKAAGC
jgi:cytidylate kinase